MSFWTTAIVAARSAVAAPVNATTIIAAGESTNTKERRQIR